MPPSSRMPGRAVRETGGRPETNRNLRDPKHVRPRTGPATSRIQILRSKDIGCRWAAQIASLPETRSLLHRIADQYRELANQLEFLDRLEATDSRARR